jgi:hypothetical protein
MSLKKDLTEAFPDLDPSKVKELDEILAKASNEGPDKVDDAMKEANRILDGHGIEAIQGDDAWVDRYWRDTVLVYVNMGDTYDTTVCYDTEEGEFFVGSWGDFMEEWEQEEEEDEEDEEASGDSDEDEEEEEEDEEEDEEEGEDAA